MEEGPHSELDDRFARIGRALGLEDFQNVRKVLQGSRNLRTPGADPKSWKGARVEVMAFFLRAFLEQLPVTTLTFRDEEWQDELWSLLLSIDHKICFFSSARRFKASRGLS